jgi:hypothetical protein
MMQVRDTSCWSGGSSCSGPAARPWAAQAPGACPPLRAQVIASLVAAREMAQGAGPRRGRSNDTPIVLATDSHELRRFVQLGFLAGVVRRSAGGQQRCAWLPGACSHWWPMVQSNMHLTKQAASTSGPKAGQPASPTSSAR